MKERLTQIEWHCVNKAFAAQIRATSALIRQLKQQGFVPFAGELEHHRQEVLNTRRLIKKNYAP